MAGRREKGRRVEVVSESQSNIYGVGDALERSEPRPPDDGAREDKKNYAERLSNSLAILIANALRRTGQFPGILPNPDGTGRETKTASGAQKKLKKTDVRFSTFDTGLELLVSVKTLSFRDVSTKKGQRVLGRYTKNMVRNDHELRAEATDLHERHPYAVLIGVLFLPFRACDDGDTDKSSFAHAVVTFRPRAGREKPSDPHQLFERFFIGLYEYEGERRGDVAFFDVMRNPPRRGRPTRVDAPHSPDRRVLSLDEMIGEVIKTYGIRNQRYIEWADEAEPIVPVLELPPEPEDDADEGLPA
jgi:hypothetical protein